MPHLSQIPVEQEVKLIVCAREPQRIFTEIAGLKIIEGFHLTLQTVNKIHDVYWDMPNHSIDSHRISLRTRLRNNRWYITFKGAAKMTDWGAVERQEVEELWHWSGFQKIADALAPYGIYFPPVSVDFLKGSPDQLLKNLGLVVLQDRQTDRQVFEVASGEKGTVLAELVLDTVHYENRGQLIHHYEIEIESKHEEGPAALRKLLDSLLNRYPSQIRNWYFSKLAIGRALEQLLSKQSRKIYLDDHQNLLPHAYDAIKALLESEEEKI